MEKPSSAVQHTTLQPTSRDLPSPLGGAPPRAGEGQRPGDLHGAEGARLRLLGLLAAGFAEEIEGEIAQLDRRFDEQRDLIEVVRDRRRSRAAEATSDDPAAALVTRTADCWAALKRTQKAVRRFVSVIEPGPPERLDLGLLAGDALTLVATRLRDLRVHVRLQASKGHFVVGRRGDLLRLFAHVLLGAAGAVGLEEGASLDGGELIPRAFVLDVHRLLGHEIASLVDDGERGAGARPSLFDVPTELGGPNEDLTIAWQIVGAHEGHIEMAASGVPCNIVLPAAVAAVDEASSSGPGGVKARPFARRPASEPARPILLWIDANDLFLEIMVQTLHEYDVRVARSAAEGMQLIAFDVKPALIFCNVRLPDRPGSELHAKLCQQSPELGARFVFVTDGVLTPEVASYVIGSGRSIIMRPIDLDQVRAMASPKSPSSSPPSSVPMPGTARTPGAARDPRRVPTEPAMPAVRLPASLSQVIPDDLEIAPATIPTTSRSRSAPSVSARGALPMSAREQELDALSRVIADTLRRAGPKKGSTIVTMLRGRGVDEAEALSVITFGLSSGVIVRDPPPSSLIRAPVQRRTVLVVDDDFDLRQTLRDILEEQGYEVDTAGNGAEALRKLRAGPSLPVVLLDLMMPVMDGWEFLDELKHDEALAGVPVVVVSASRREGPLPGVGELLSKPLDYYKLVTSIERSTRTPSP